MVKNIQHLQKLLRIIRYKKKGEKKLNKRMIEKKRIDLVFKS